MRGRYLFRLAWLGLGSLILVSVFSALATSLIVQPGRLDQITLPVTANDLKPAECDGLDLTTVIAGGAGGADNDLILGGAGSDSLTGGEGDDCIVAGGGGDSLNGGSGADVLLGGEGDDLLSGDEGANDVCYGGPGSDSFDPSCETGLD